MTVRRRFGQYGLHIPEVIDQVGQDNNVKAVVGHFSKIHGGAYNKRTVEKLLHYLVIRNEMIALGQERFITPELIADIKHCIRSCIVRKGEFSLQDCQNVLGYGRTQAVPLLEYLDKTGFTVRRGNLRVLSSDRAAP